MRVTSCQGNLVMVRSSFHLETPYHEWSSRGYQPCLRKVEDSGRDPQPNLNDKNLVWGLRLLTLFCKILREQVRAQ